jgi:hypothetical protein
MVGDVDMGWWGSSEVGDGYDRRARGVREREENGAGWAGPVAAGLVRFPGRPSGCLSFFCVLILFFISCFSDLFHNSNIWIPNAFKQVSKFL